MIQAFGSAQYVQMDRCPLVRDDSSLSKSTSREITGRQIGVAQYQYPSNSGGDDHIKLWQSYDHATKIGSLLKKGQESLQQALSGHRLLVPKMCHDGKTPVAGLSEIPSLFSPRYGIPSHDRYLDKIISGNAAAKEQSENLKSATEGSWNQPR